MSDISDDWAALKANLQAAYGRDGAARWMAFAFATMALELGTSPTHALRDVTPELPISGALTKTRVTARRGGEVIR